MSGTPEEEEKSKRRKEMLAMMVQQTKRRERIQLKSINEENKQKQPKQPEKLWKNEMEKLRYDISQFSYVEPYVKAFEAEKIAPTSKEELDKVGELPYVGRLKGMIGRGRGGSRRLHETRTIISSNLTPNKMEQISTILPPTDVVQEAKKDSFDFDNDYTSNITIGQVQGPYFRNYKINTDLPIYESRDYIMNSINSYNVVIIEGATGCGKTTQVPMYILERRILGNPNLDEPCPVIYVTQPRRIAAKSIAKRVCEEHNWELGSLVGYQVGLDKKTSQHTILTYCTAGVLLQKLIQDKTLMSYTHIVIDEAHERDSDTDLLLMMIRTLMRKEKSFFRLIIMSATMDTTKLRKYFTCELPFGHIGISEPILCKLTSTSDLQRRLNMVYLEKVKNTFDLSEPMPQFDLDEPAAFDLCYSAAVKIIIEVVPQLDTYGEKSKSTLVFLPGLAEITKLHRLLKQSKCPDNIVILPLHSCLSNSDQYRVFEPVKPGCRKVILATNIAESSITVKDVGFIVDFCLTKTLLKDPITKFPVLKLQWATRDKCVQRAGRTGRCCEGKVFRLVPIDFYNMLTAYAKPELLTAPLELSVLRVKNFQMGELKQLFALVLDPPAISDIRTAVMELKQVGGLSSTYEGVLSDLDGDLTELGRIISNLPIDVHLSKLIVIGALLDVLDDAIIIASSLSTNRTVVRHIYGDLYETYINKVNWSRGSTSDLFINLDIYKDFVYYKDELKKDQRWLEDWCRSRLLDEKKLNEVSALANEITSRLEQLNVKTTIRPNIRIEDRDKSEDRLMLKIAICSAFYPNYFLNHQFDVPEVKKALCTLDPTKTLVIGNLPLNQTPLYCEQILSQLEELSEKVHPIIEYVADNSRALLVFNNKTNITMNNSEFDKTIDETILQKSKPIDLSLYLAIKYAEVDKLLIREYQDDIAYERMNYYTEYRKNLPFGNKLPPPWTKIVRGRAANNSRILDASNEEYGLIDKDFFVEIEFDQSQSTLDLDELHSLEVWEEESRTYYRRTKAYKTEADLIHEASDPEHRLYKKFYKKLHGPYSPVQMTFYSVLEKSRGFTVEVDNLSINSIILDPEYEERKSQMLVAASVGRGKGNNVLARDTTLMPRVPGFSTMMSLLFAQYYRLVFNMKTNCLAGAIFGIGWNEEDEPLDPEYQVEINFDVHLTKLDIQLINECRRLISTLIRTIDLVENPGAPRAEQQRRLRDLLMTIIRRNRYKITASEIQEYVSPDNEMFFKDSHNVPKEQLEKLGLGETRCFLPIMKASKEFKEMDMYIAIRQNLNEMTRIQNYESKPPLEGIRCLLCGAGQTCFFQMQSKIVGHIQSDEHNEKLKVFELYEQRAKENAHFEADPADEEVDC